MDINKLNDRNEQISNRILIVFTIAFVYVAFLMFLDNLLSVATTFLAGIQTTQAAMIISIVVLALGIFLKANKKLENRAFSPELIIGFGAISALAMAAIYTNILEFQTIIAYLYAIAPITAVLHMVYYLYHREFFVIGILGVCGISGVWVQTVEQFTANKILVAMGIAVATIVITTIIGMTSFKKCKIMGKTSPFKSQKGTIMPVTMLVTLASILGAYFMVDGYAMVVMFALIGLLFMTAVYYTIKLF